MPWAWPSGASKIGPSGQGVGGPLVMSRKLYPGSTNQFDTGDLSKILFSPVENRLVALRASAGTDRGFFGLNHAYDFLEQFANNNQITVGIQNAVIYPNFASSAGFLFLDSNGDPWRASSCDPLTSTFQVIPAPTGISNYCFGMSNGQVIALDQGSPSNHFWISFNGGVTWPNDVNLTANGNTDFGHSERGPIVSPDGRIVALSSVTGVALTNNVDAGNAGFINVLNTGAFITTGAFNTHGTMLIFSLTGTDSGRAFVSRAPFGTFTQIPDTTNCFVIRDGEGQDIQTIMYSQSAGGWYVLGLPNSSRIVGFIPESDPTKILQGFWADGTIYGNTGGDGLGAVDGNGDFIVVGNDWSILNNVRLET